MRAVVLHEYGGPDMLRPASVERPVRGAGELLVRVRACGVCGHDLLARRGALGTRLPQILGHEIAGEIAEADEPGALAVGDRVVLNQRLSCGECAACARGDPNLCTLGAGFYGEDLAGGYAEYVVARPGNAVRLPPDVSFEAAATLPCAVGTGLHALDRLELRRGETFLVTGANGGVGIHAVALAKLSGAVVVAVIRDATTEEEVIRAGADTVVMAAEGEFHRAVRERHPDGVDAAIECVGTPTLPSTLRSLRPGGRLAVVGNVQPEQPLELKLGLLILKEVTLLGSSHATPADLARAANLVASQQIIPHVARTFPFERAAEAHAFAESATAAGRIVLRAA